jgi:hypothetical protein
MSDQTQKYNELFRKVAALERRIAKLEDGYHELDNVVDPQGWIGEAFRLLEEDIEEFKVENRQRFDSIDRKLDIILKHITGISGES